MSNPSGQGTDLWVKTDVTPLGEYRTTITVGADRAWSLGREQAIEYAVACIARATDAEHDTAVWALFSQKMGVEDRAIAQVLADARGTRTVDHGATEPLHFVPGVSLTSQKPFVRMELDGKSIGQLDPSRLRAHALGVLEALASIDLDEALVKVFMEQYDAPENSARGMVMDLQNYWPSDE